MTIPVRNIARPAGALKVAGGLLRGGYIGVTGTSFYIHMRKVNEKFSTPTVDGTGDGDRFPVTENNGMMYGDFSYRGAMISAHGIGLKNMILSGRNPLAVVVQKDSDRLNNYNIMITDIEISEEFDPVSPYIGVSILAKMTQTNPDKIENTVEEPSSSSSSGL